jgi:hypothetical protein
MYFMWVSEQTAAFALHDIKRLVFKTDVESVYSAVRTESLYKTGMLPLERVNFTLYFAHTLPCCLAFNVMA